MKNFTKVFSFIYTFVLFTSCQKDTQPPPIYTNQGSIGAQGGIVKTSDGASIEIPTGVLNTSTTISITNTTETDTIANSGCRIYELKPDGLKFTDSVTITLPYDGSHIDLNSQEENFGVSIIVYQDTAWVNLKAKVDSKAETISAKTTHFSTYVVSYPENYADYFQKNKLKNGNALIVPHYCQGISNWCAFYSLSMVTRYAGYDYKGPMFASLFGKTTYTGFYSGLNLSFNLPFIGKKIAEIGISSEDVYPPWVNGEELGGYILKKLDMGQPVWVCNNSLHHVFVVTGHSANGFFINDPSGALLTKVFDVDPWSPFNLTNILVSYSQFMKTVKGFSSTLVISSTGNSAKTNVTLNFLPGGNSISVNDINGVNVGELEINGKNKPNGFALINKMNTNVFNGSDFIAILPLFSNSDGANKTVNFNYKVDNKDVIGSPVMVEIPAKTTLFNVPSDQNNKIILIKFQLSNLTKGNHTLSVELTSLTNPNLKYDSYDFPFQIETVQNITIPSVTTTPVTIFTSTSATVGGNVTSDGNASVTDRGVYWGTSPDPVTSGTKLQIESGTGVFSTSLTGLIPNTPYYVKAYAINSQGTSYGAQVSFTTLASTGDIIFNPNLTYGTVSDVDGNSYKTLQIGTQVWMAENLKTTKYKDNTIISTYWWFNNNATTYKANYGALYDWYSVTTGKLCPTGWHVPTDPEWSILIKYIDPLANPASSPESAAAGGKLKEISLTHWTTPNTGATNETGFTALPSGYRSSSGAFNDLGLNGIWWSSTEYSTSNGYSRDMDWNNSTVHRRNDNKSTGFSVRCVQGDPTIPTNGLVAYYPFNGNALDESGNSNNGTVNGATLTADRKGNSNSAYSFNGTSNYITVQNSSSLQLTTLATFNVWVSIPSVLSYDTRPAAGPHLICKGATYGDKWANYSVQLTGQNGVIAFEFNSTSGTQYNGVSTTNPFGRDNWHMVTVVYQSGGQIKFYIDGILADTIPISTTSFGVSSLPLYIGVRYLTSVYTGGFTGKLDNLRIYNRALTDQEISALYNE